MTQFNLSKHERHSELGEIYYPKSEVKEFIKLLKEEIKDNNDRCDDCIDFAFDKLAGDKLT